MCVCVQAHIEEKNKEKTEGGREPRGDGRVVADITRMLCWPDKATDRRYAVNLHPHDGWLKPSNVSTPKQIYTMDLVHDSGEHFVCPSGLQRFL